MIAARGTLQKEVTKTIYAYFRCGYL